MPTIPHVVLTNPTSDTVLCAAPDVHRHRFTWVHAAPRRRLLIQGQTGSGGGLCAHAVARQPASAQDLAQAEALIPLLDDPRLNLAANAAHRLLVSWSVPSEADQAWRERDAVGALARALATKHPEIYAVLTENAVFGPNQVVITKLTVVERVDR